MGKNSGNPDPVCEKNRIHYLCSVGTDKSQPEGPPFQLETRRAEFPTEQWTRGPILFLIYHDRTVQYCVIHVSVGDVTEVDVYNDACCTNQLEKANKME